MAYDVNDYNLIKTKHNNITISELKRFIQQT